MSERSGTLCLKPGECLSQQGMRLQNCLTDKEAEQYIEKSPMLPAEKLCLKGILSHQESRNATQLVDDWASICYDLDHAIALPAVHSRDFQTILVQQISSMIHRNTDRKNWLNTTHPMISLQLKRLNLFMPAFINRIQDRRGNPQLTRHIHDNLVGYIQSLEDIGHNFTGPLQLKKQIASHRAECEVMALFTRTGEIAYPALAREEASQARKQHNHDFYTLQGKQKSAYQVKTSARGKGYAGVSVIRHYEILRAFHQDSTTKKIEWRPTKSHEDYEWPNPYQYTEILTGQKMSPLTTLLIEEKNMGARLPVDKRNALNLASSYVKSISSN